MAGFIPLIDLRRKDIPSMNRFMQIFWEMKRKVILDRKWSIKYVFEDFVCRPT